ncbi:MULTISPECIES: hypothetical protein [Lactobacillaceae]|uniref:hypothetical protein n=1 Tax=Lactobacillaceae TaxID=33958 RepID=UPI000C1B62DB|nr:MULTISPECIES: hypothetical protein [Lactobacillaceae]
MKDLYNRLSKSKTVYMFLTALILVFILPLIFTVFHISQSDRIIWLFFIVNIIFSGFTGWFAHKYELSFYNLIIFPLIFIISVFIQHGQYGYYLAGIYLVISLLIYFVFNQNKN